MLLQTMRSSFLLRQSCYDGILGRIVFCPVRQAICCALRLTVADGADTSVFHAYIKPCHRSRFLLLDYVEDGIDLIQAHLALLISPVIL